MNATSNMEKLDTIKYNKFIGLYDLNDPMPEPSMVALKTATNINIDKKYRIRSRTGRTLKLSGNYKNLWTNGSIYLATKDSELYLITPGETYIATVIYTGINENQVDYANVGDLIYITDNLQTLAYEDGTVRAMRTTVAEYKAPMPGGHLMTLFKSQMYIAKEVSGKHLVIESEPGNYERYDRREDISFATFPEKLTMLKAVEDGIFLSSDKTYFMSGSNLENMTLTRVADYKAILGTAKQIKGTYVGGEYYANAVMWMSEFGICVGSAGGQFRNLTEGRKDRLSARAGASYIKYGTINQYVANTKGGG